MDQLRVSTLFIGYPAIALSSMMIVFVALASDISRLPSFLKSSWIYLGRISYGLYVFHMLCIQVIASDGWGNFDVRIFCSLIATVAISIVSFKYLERPFLRLKLRYTHVLSRPGG